MNYMNIEHSRQRNVLAAAMADGKVYLPTEKDLWVFQAGQDKKQLAKIRLPNKMYNSPVVTDGVLYLATQRYLFAVRAAGSGTAAEDKQARREPDSRAKWYREWVAFGQRYCRT